MVFSYIFFLFSALTADLVIGACCKVSILDGNNSVSLLTTKIVPLDSTSAEIYKPKDEVSLSKYSSVKVPMKGNFCPLFYSRKLKSMLH